MTLIPSVLVKVWYSSEVAHTPHFAITCDMRTLKDPIFYLDVGTRHALKNRKVKEGRAGMHVQYFPVLFFFPKPPLEWKLDASGSVL